MTDERLKEILQPHIATIGDYGSQEDGIYPEDALKALQQVRDEMLKETVRLYELIRKAYDDYHTASFAQFQKENNLI